MHAGLAWASAPALRLRVWLSESGDGADQLEAKLKVAASPATLRLRQRASTQDGRQQKCRCEAKVTVVVMVWRDCSNLESIQAAVTGWCTSDFRLWNSCYVKLGVKKKRRTI